MKTTNPEIKKKKSQWFSSTFGQAEETIRNLEDKVIESIQFENREKKKRLRTNLTEFKRPNGYH